MEDPDPARWFNHDLVSRSTWCIHSGRHGWPGDKTVTLVAEKALSVSPNSHGSPDGLLPFVDGVLVVCISTETSGNETICATGRVCESAYAKRFEAK